jgi:hypothetical protein
MPKQIRTYILVVGRDNDDKPVRALAKYDVPLRGLTDRYDKMNAAEFRARRTALKKERERIDNALFDMELEGMRRLEATK